MAIIVFSAIGSINCQSSCEMHVWRGSFANSAGNYDKAITEYTKAIEICPDDVIAYSLRADVYQQTGKYNLAKADLLKVIELSEEPALTRNAERRLNALIERQ